LLAGEPTAPARLAELLLEPLVRRVLKSTGGADRADSRSTCCQTLARYLCEPEAYDAGRGPLLAWLALDARRDVLNDLDSARARRETVDVTIVEVRGGTGNVFTEPAQLRSVEEEALDHTDPFDLPPETVAVIRKRAKSFSAEELSVIELMGEGVRDTAAYADVLGISHLPLDEQRAAVKREKDRLSRQLERLRERLA